MSFTVKTNRLSLIKHEVMLRRAFPDSLITRQGDKSLLWAAWMRPSSTSCSYRVSLRYVSGRGIAVYVLEPKLEFFPGIWKLPHVYSTQDQKLCLFRPSSGQWDPSRQIATTIVPWIAEWLLHYEYWAATGVWSGGGIHIEKTDESIYREEFSSGHLSNNSSGIRAK